MSGKSVKSVKRVALLGACPKGAQEMNLEF